MSRSRAKRRGFTLVELLVVIAVIVTVTALVVPSVRLLLEDRKIREAARAVDAFVVEAQTEAVVNGAGGIWIERDNLTPNTATRLYKVKTPPPYTGDFLGASCRIVMSGRNTGEATNGLDSDGNQIVDDLFYASLRFNKQTSLNAVNLVKPGDLIQFDFKGAWFTVQQVPVEGSDPIFTDPILVTSRTGPIQEIAAPAFLDVQFKVLRLPQRSSAGYLDLPKSTMLDLSKSGLTVLDLNGDSLGNDALSQGNEFANLTNPAEPILLIFGQDGGLELIVSNNTTLAPDRSVHLLLANDRRETEAELDPANDANTLADLSNFWLTITRQGTVATTNVSDDSTVSDPNFVGELLRASRRNAREVKSEGGG